MLKDLLGTTALKNNNTKRLQNGIANQQNRVMLTLNTILDGAMKMAKVLCWTLTKP